MTTTEINAQRNNSFRGEFATLLVTVTRQRLQRSARTIAIGCDTNGGAFKVVQPPADFAEAVAEVDNRPVAAALNHDAIDNEVIGEEIGRRPFEW